MSQQSSYRAPYIKTKDSYLEVIGKFPKGRSVIIEIQVLHRQALDQLALYNTATTDGTKLMIEELHKGFHPKIDLFYLNSNSPVAVRPIKKFREAMLEFSNAEDVTESI
ncbi:MAG TPA: hypothetical protein VLA84_04865 [Microcoleus sp.]|nr:hypothetical protein [Microcoleus sp.]